MILLVPHATNRHSVPTPPRGRCRHKVPFCLPERLLVQLHNDGMAVRARKQVDRLRSLFPDLMQTLRSHPKTAAYAVTPGEGSEKQGAAAGATVETDVAPMALLWAFAMVRSRAFNAGDDQFAFVPFLVSACRSVAFALLHAPTTFFEVLFRCLWSVVLVSYSPRLSTVCLCVFFSSVSRSRPVSAHVLNLCFFYTQIVLSCVQ